MTDRLMRELEAIEEHDKAHCCAVYYKDGKFDIMYFNFYEQPENYDRLFITGKISEVEAENIIRFCNFIRALK